MPALLLSTCIFAMMDVVDALENGSLVVVACSLRERILGYGGCLPAYIRD